MKQLRKIRKERGLTQEQLARRSGIPRPNISKYEQGERDPHEATATKLADALGVTVDDLRADDSPYWLDQARRMAERLERSTATADMTVYEVARVEARSLLSSLRHWLPDLSPSQQREAFDLVDRLILVGDRTLHRAQQVASPPEPEAAQEERQLVLQGVNG